MAQYIVGTNDRYTQLICNTSPSISGSYPNLNMNIAYSFQIRLTAQGSWYYNGQVFTFHTNRHIANIGFSFGSGGGTTGVLASGNLVLGWGGRTTTHTPGFSTAGAFSGSGGAVETLTIPTAGQFSSTTTNVTINSITFRNSGNSPYNWWQPVLLNTSSQFLTNMNFGDWLLSGLTPGTSYEYRTALMGRDGEINYLQSHGFRTLDDQVKVWYKKGSSWVKAPLWTKQGGTWRKAKYVYIKVGGTWRRSVSN